MDCSLSLRAKGLTAANSFFCNLAIAPVKFYGSPNCTSVANGPLKVKAYPVCFFSKSVLKKYSMLILIGHDEIKSPVFQQINFTYRPAIQSECAPNTSGYFPEPTGTIVKPDFICLVSRKRTTIHGRPVFCINNDISVAPHYPGIIVPIICVGFIRYVPICNIYIEEAVAVKINKLTTISPFANFNAHISCKISKGKFCT